VTDRCTHRIFIVDDDAGVLKAQSRVLREEGWTAPALLGVMAERLGLRPTGKAQELAEGFALASLSRVPNIAWEGGTR